MLYDYDRTRQATRAIPIDKFELMVLAEKFVRALPLHLKTLGRSKEDWDTPLVQLRGFNDWHFTLGDFEVNDVQGHPVKVPVYAAGSMDIPTAAKRWISGGSIYVKYDSGSAGLGHKSYMMVNIYGMSTINGLMSDLETVEKEVYSVLIHEGTHLRDRFTTRGDKAYDKGPSAQTYYNQPHEVRAFMQQTVDEALDYTVAQARKVGVGIRGIKLTSTFVEQALKSSSTWQRIKIHLQPINEKLVRKAVVRALHDEWRNLEKQYPVTTEGVGSPV